MNKKPLLKIISKEVGKEIYTNDMPDTYIVKLTDDILIDNRVKKIKGLAEISVKINSHLNQLMNSYNIPTDYISTMENNYTVIKKTERIPIYLRVLNNVDKKLSKTFKSKLYKKLDSPIFEIYLEDNPNQIVNEHHLLAFKLLTMDETKVIMRIASKVNAILKSFFERRNYCLAEIILNFGKDSDKILLASSFNINKIVLLNCDNLPAFEINSARLNKIKATFQSLQNLIY
ncbi:MAG: hypothetical protein N3A61_01410 [Ignavibacteria bacterium]|nr:hypothetical protein [Ignavibacteria bacterium]